MVRVRITERQKSRILTTWLAGLTLATVMHYWSLSHGRQWSVVTEDLCRGTAAPLPSINVNASLVSTHRGVVETLLDGPLEATDERLVQWVKEGGGGRVFPPSTLPYNITNDNPGGWRGTGVWKFYVKVVDRYFGKKEDGFFVEAGALDGELLSTTLKLEQKLGWSGLLVEPRPDMFQQLLQKHRKAYTARFCLSEKPYPHKTSFWMSPDYIKESIAFSAVSSQLFEKISADQQEIGNVVNVHCIPLITLLMALGRRHIDLFVLDVEGVEWGVIDLFPFDQITVDVLTVERKYKGDTDRVKFIQLVESKGFKLAHSLKDDFVFIRNAAHIAIDYNLNPLGQ